MAASNTSSALRLSFLVGGVLGQVVGEGVGVKVDDGAKHDAQLCGGQRGRGVVEDALERVLALLAEFVAPGQFCLAFLLLALFLLLPFFGPAFLLCVVLLLLLLRAAGWRSSASSSVSTAGAGAMTGAGCLGCSGGGAGVVDGAMVVGANGEDGAYALAVDHEGGFGGGAGWLRLGVGVVGGGVDLAEVSALDGSGRFSLGLRHPSSICTSSGRAAISRSMWAFTLVWKHGASRHWSPCTSANSGVESAAAGAGDASSCGWV